MVTEDTLVKVRTIQAKHLKQMVAPSYKVSDTSLFRRVHNAVKSGAAKPIGWTWKGDLELRNEHGNGEYYAARALYVVEWENQFFLMPVDDNWTAESDKYGKQLFV